jgi:clan AA aspartic protease (TIGR02281 family)
MVSFPKIVRGFLLVALCVACMPASSEIYRWTDAEGKMHFTQDLAQVPPRVRAAAKDAAEAPKVDTLVQHYTPPPPPARLSKVRMAKHAATSSKTHRIQVQRAGPSMRVVVRINGELDVPFIIDTGATDVVLPLYAAKKLGLKISGPGVRTAPRQTANGTIHAPVVMLDSVKLGTAEVNDVSGLALKNMSYGLLGLGFFNHFTYNIDSANGIVLLTENNLAEEGVLRGGKGKAEWRSEFFTANNRIEKVRLRIEEAPFGRVRERERFEAIHAESVERLRLLEVEADDARVPFAWRD